MAPPVNMSFSNDFPRELNNLPLVEQMKWSTETSCPGFRSSFFKIPALSTTGLVDLAPGDDQRRCLAYMQALYLTGGRLHVT